MGIEVQHTGACPTGLYGVCCKNSTEYIVFVFIRSCWIRTDSTSYDCLDGPFCSLAVFFTSDLTYCLLAYISEAEKKALSIIIKPERFSNYQKLVQTRPRSSRTHIELLGIRWRENGWRYMGLKSISRSTILPQSKRPAVWYLDFQSN